MSSALPSTMRAYRMLAWQAGPELVEVPRPTPGHGQVVVAVAGCGLCHSDLAMMAMPAGIGEHLGWRVPFTLGHETAGWVEAVGTGVTGWTVGDGVALASPSSCGRCRWCHAGLENRCAATLVGRGYGQDGGLADAVLVDDPRHLLALGSLDPASAGPLTDAGATSHHAVRRVVDRVGTGATVVVLGVGGLGAFVVQLLRELGDARVVAVDPDPARRAVAAAHGADLVIAGVDDATSDALRDAVGPDGADAVIDLVGTDATIATAVGATGAGGVVALVGSAGGTLRRPWHGALPRDGEVFTFQGSDLADARAVIDLAAAGRLQVEVDPFALDHVADAYRALQGGTLAGRAVVRP